MSEILMGKPKRVGDSAMVLDLGDGMLAIGTPTVAFNPITKKNEEIQAVVKTKTQTTCPSCKKENGPGIEITFLKTGYFIYACTECNQFVWCREKER